MKVTMRSDSALTVRMTKDKELFIIVDGNAHICRAYFGIQGLTDPFGRPCNAVYGFARILLYLIERYGPSHLIVTFDSYSQKRKELYSGYKESRKKHKDLLDDLTVQIPIAREMTEALGIKTVREEGYEADDLIASLAQKGKSAGIPTLLFTHDKDIAQLVTKDGVVKLLRTYNKKKPDTILDWEGIKEEYGVYPDQIAPLLAIVGDESDDIPGVKGVGPKTAIPLIEKYHTLDNLYQNIEEVKGKLKDKLQEQKNSALLSYQLAVLGNDPVADAAVPEVRDCEFLTFALTAKEYFRKMNFQSLLGRI